MFFNRKEVYLGSSIKDFNRVRDILDKEKIKYKYELINNSTQWLGDARGTVRSMGLNFNNNLSTFSISVKGDDYEKALFLISRQDKNEQK